MQKRGINLIICGRRQERLDILQRELSIKTQVHTLSFDVRDKEEVFTAIQSLPLTFKNIDILINNAGNAHGLDSLESGNVDDWDNMIDTNLKGLLYVSKAVMATMIENKSGHIINIGSTAGKTIYQKGNVYCASKHAVNALNQGMRMDLNKYGIRVSAVNPGMVETEFSNVRFKGDQEKATAVYENANALQAEDLADILHFVVTRPYHVNIADLVVLPTTQGEVVLA